MSVRPPAVAGAFYEARADRLERDVRSHLPPESTPRSAFGAIVPHAGYVYSGLVAGAVYAQIRIPPTCIVLCPNHTGFGAAAALDPSDAWRTPLGDVPVDRRLADRLAALAPSLEADRAAHAREHSLEVQLPFLQVLRPDVAIVAICLGAPRLALCREVGDALAAIAAAEAEPPLLIASSDMNHYESREEGRRKDDLALARIGAIDPGGAVPDSARRVHLDVRLPPGDRAALRGPRRGRTAARVVARRDSGDETGDTASVVGYAGVIVD